MKRYLWLLPAALVLCICLYGCGTQPGKTDTDPTSTTEPADASVSSTGETETTGLSEETASTGLMTPGEYVTPPDEMPDAPEADYSLPPDEKPGSRFETSDK